MSRDLIHEVMHTEIPDVVTLEQILESEEDQEELFKLADATKRKEYGNKVFIRAIIEFSSYCRRACAYCGINAKVPKAERYRMSPDEIVETALEAARWYKTVVLQSAEDPYYTPQMLADIVGRIRAKSDVAITMSVGERSPMAYQAMRDAGADRFLIKHETADDLLYEKYHETKLSDRLACQEELRRQGYEVGSGFMVGLPGQTDAALAQDILLLQKMHVDMAGIGPFIPHPDTELADFPAGSPAKTLRALALTRILLPKCHLPSTTALNEMDGFNEALNSGADVVMQKATPYRYRKLYDLYPKGQDEDVSLEEQKKKLDGKLLAMELEPD